MKNALLALAVGLSLTACATTKPLGSEVPSIRVVSFALSSTVTLDGSTGKPEPHPALLGGDFDGFPVPLTEALALAWSEFPDLAAAATGRGPWLGPGPVEEHPVYAEVGWDVQNPYSLTFGGPMARGYLWPEGFRFVDPADPAGGIQRLAADYPGEPLLVVQYRAYTEDADDGTEWVKPTFRMGLLATLSLYSPSGELLSRETIIGRSSTKAKRIGAKVDRSQYPKLIAEAQADVVKQWAQKPVFRKED